MKKQVIYTIIGVLFLAILIVGGTYAFYVFSVTGSEPVNTVSSNFEISYVGGGSTFDGPLDLVDNKEDGYVKTLKIKVADDSVAAKLNLYIQIEQLSQSLAVDPFKWEVYGYNSRNEEV